MREKKRRKKHSSTTALLGKRKKFSTILGQRCLVVLLILVLAYIAGLNYFVSNKKGETVGNYYRAQGTMVRYINSLAEKREEPEFSNYVQFQMAMMAASRGFFSMLQEKDSGEVIADCGERLFLIRSFPDVQNSTIYVCEPSQIPGWVEYRQELQTHNKGLVHLYETVDFASVYTDGRYFIPDGMQIEAAYIKDMEYYLMRNNYQIHELMNIEIEPPSTESIPVGYEKAEPQEKSGIELGSLVVGYGETSPSKNYMCSSDASYESLIELKEFLQLQTQKVSGSDGMAESFFSIELTSMMEMTLKGGREVSFLSATVYDVWEQYGGWMVGIAVVLLLVGIFMAYLLARASYARLKAQYDVEDYRRNLMNTMAHDLKSPLMSISGYAENLRDNLHTEKQEHYSEVILNNVQYMNGIIESVLSLSKSESGNVVLKREALNVSEKIQELLKTQENQLQEKGLTVELTGELTIEVDKVLFGQVLHNLLDNAVKYASNNSVIRVMIGAGQMSFQNSCEMDLRTVADTLCDPFVVGDASRGRCQGSGLGLAIARNICQMHGFELQIVCEEESFEARIVI